MVMAQILNKKIYLNIILGLGIFFFIGLMHTNIGFHGDDYGLIFNGQYSSMNDVIDIFKNGDIMHNAAFDKEENLYPKCPSFRHARPSFLEVIYRPLLILIMSTEYKLFGPNAFATHCIHALLHTFAALIIFNILLLFIYPYLAFLCSLFFAFHTSLKNYFFWQCYIQGTFELFCLILILFFMYKTYISHKTIYLIFALISFLCALLTRETLLFLPSILAAAAYIFRRKIHNDGHSTNQILGYLSTITIPIFTYIGIRLWAYPLTFEINRIGINDLERKNSFFIYLKNKFYDLLTYFFDLFGLKDIPSGYMLLKMCFLFFLIGGIAILWYRSKNKKTLLVLTLATAILSWPSLLFFHSSRYLYLPVFFLSFFIGILLNELTEKKVLRLLTSIFFTIYVIIQAYITIPTLKSWSDLTGIGQSIRMELASLSRTHSNIVALGCPENVVKMAAATSLKLFNADQKSSITNTLLHETLPNGTPIKALKWSGIDGNLYIESQSRNSVWFSPKYLLIKKSIGCVEPLEQEGEKIYKIKITLAPEATKNSILIWNLDTKTFEPINNIE